MCKWLLICAAAWPTFHGAPDLRGTAETVVPDEPALQWRYLGGGSVLSTPVSDGERIFFTGRKGTVTALDLDGKKVWSQSLTRTNDTGQVMAVRLDAPLAVCGGRVLAATTRGTLHALEASTGTEQWRYETDGVFIGSPNLIGEETVILLDQSSGILHAVELETGKPLWKTEGVERCDGSPGIGPDHIVFGSCLAALHVFDHTGNQLHDIDVGGDGQLAGGVAVVGSLAFAGTRDGRLVCADLASGDLVWTASASEDEAFAVPAVAHDRVVHTADDGTVYAVRRTDGTILWRMAIGELPSSPVIVGERVAVSADGMLYLLDLSSGKKMWSKAVSDDITSPAVIGTRLVVGADDGSVSAFGGKGQE